MIDKEKAKTLIVSKVKYPKGRIFDTDAGVSTPELSEEKKKEDPNDKFMWWDATRPFEGDCEVKLFAFSDEEGKEVFWHSSAHVLGETMENEFGVHLTHGPPTSDGFFYDCYTGNDKFTEAHYKEIEKAAIKIVNSKQKFERLVLTKEDALEMFAENPFKVQTIKGKVKDGDKVTAYRCGDLIDLCTGPHIPNTNIIKAFKVMKNSSSYWLSSDENDSL